MEALRTGDKIKLKYRVFTGAKGFLQINKRNYIPRGTTGTIKKRIYRKGNILYVVNFGKYGTWDIKRGDFSKI